MNPERAHDGEAIVLLVKCHELEVVSKFLDEYSGVSPLVPKVVGYGVESSECPAAHCTTTLDEAIDEAKSLMASRAPAACSPKRRCPQCNKTYKHKSAQQLPWVGDKMR